MLTEPRKSFSETFIVWNDYINLVGALFPSNKGRASVRGTIRFKKWYSISSRRSFSNKLKIANSM
jgi:hypothetical protein